RAARKTAARGGAPAARQAAGRRDRAHPRGAGGSGAARATNIITEERDIVGFVKRSVIALAAAGVIGGAAAQEPVKIGIVTFLSGPAAAPFGVPAKNAAEFVIEELNNGKAPAPYNKRGYGGSPIEMVIVDEAGSTTTQVTEFRNLVQRHDVDVVIGYVSSGNCLAVAPVAEELKKLTNFFDCGTPRIFEDGSYKYVFRTSPTATMDSVGAALYVKDAKPGVKSIAGLNQNYAWGQDSWGDFELAMKVLVPNLEVKTSQMPKLFVGKYKGEPNYASYQMAQAILAVKLAWEKAQQGTSGKKPSNEQVGAALENMTFEGPGGTVKMAIGKGHQAIMETAYGQTKLSGGKLTVVNVKRYPAEKVNPPEGMKAADWIKGGFKAQ